MNVLHPHVFVGKLLMAVKAIFLCKSLSFGRFSSKRLSFGRLFSRLFFGNLAMDGQGRSDKD
jgi:hypothetical protein